MDFSHNARAKRLSIPVKQVSTENERQIMEMRLHVVSKVETEHETGNTFHLHVNISVERENLAAQGGGVLASFKVEPDLFNATQIGDDLVFIHNNTVHGLKVV